VLEFSKIRKGLKQASWISPNEVIQTIQQELEPLIKEKGALIKVDDIPQIHFGETELFLILKNLIENGIKYNTSEHPSVHIGYKEEDSMHHFSVQDNGIGVDKGFEQKIFNMFFRLHNKQEFEGTGLGLAICKRIMDKVNGKIWLESKEGEGSTFHFSIPKKMKT
jgi:light-regulated signal transduction histidine kinase (bacteriophytochrome)